MVNQSMWVDLKSDKANIVARILFSEEISYFMSQRFIDYGFVLKLRMDNVL